jgi:hypothetical protein
MAQHGRKRALDSSVEWPAQTRFYEAIYPRDAHCAIPGAVKLLARYGWRMDGSK